MEAGRELDRLVAEKVMGWTVGDVGPYKNCGWYINGEWTGYFTTECASQDCPGFSPSEFIDVAWVVVEKLLALCPMRDFTVQVRGNAEYAFEGHMKGKSIAGYSEEGWEGTDIFPKAVADTPAHAICLAALKAIES